MIFEIYYSNIRYSNDKMRYLTTIIKESPPEDSFMFIVTKDQTEHLERQLRDSGIEPMVKVKTPFLTNAVHLGSGRNMKLYILSNGEVKKQVQAAPKKRVSQLKLF